MEEDVMEVVPPAAPTNVVPATPAAANAAAISATVANEDSSPETATDHFADDYLSQD